MTSINHWDIFHSLRNANDKRELCIAKKIVQFNQLRLQIASSHLKIGYYRKRIQRRVHAHANNLIATEFGSNGSHTLSDRIHLKLNWNNGLKSFISIGDNEWNRFSLRAAVAAAAVPLDPISVDSICQANWT